MLGGSNPQYTIRNSWGQMRFRLEILDFKILTLYIYSILIIP